MLIDRLCFLWIMDFCNLYMHIHEEMGHEVCTCMISVTLRASSCKYTKERRVTVPAATTMITNHLRNTFAPAQRTLPKY